MTTAMRHEARMVSVNGLKPFEGNPRRGDLDVIRQSLRANGQYRPIVVRTETSEILAGNHTWMAAIAEGWTEIWATYVSCDDATAKRINLVDNRAPELGGYDGEALVALLQDLPDLEGTGWNGEDLERLVEQLNPELPGDGAGIGGEPPDTVPGVLISCESTGQQQKVIKGLRAAQDGDTALLPQVLKGLNLQAVEL